MKRTIFFGFLAIPVASLVIHQRQSTFFSSGSDLALTGRAVEDGQSCQELVNMDTHFTIEVSVGTPPQKFDLVADTGSNALIVKSCVCEEASDECHPGTGECFVGTNRSSTFVGPTKGDSPRMFSFGSGDVVVYAATDVVQVGSARATMNESLFLMVNRELAIAGKFEGILGLGFPEHVQNAKTPPKIAGADPANQKRAVEEMKKVEEQMKKDAKKMGYNVSNQFASSPRFLEEADVDRFSICMNDAGTSGAMRLQPPKASKMLKQIGYHHWVLDLQGMSVGSSEAPVKICDKASKPAHQDTACAAIPDSGTTLILGPLELVDQLYAELCSRWPRCQDHSTQNHSTEEKLEPASIFRSLVSNCNDWIKDGGLKEVPSVFLHLGGADGQTQTIELTSWSWIIERKYPSGDVVCEALFGEWDRPTALHGPSWIIGTPLFFEYQVVFSTVSASIGFHDASCGSCDPMQDSTTTLMNDRRFSPSRRIPRVMRGQPRMPTMDRVDPL